MEIDATYKGYRIKYRRAGELWALIWPENSGLALSEIPRATIAEGQKVLEERVKQTIDADIQGRLQGI
jgi:hypothetical protein